MNRYTDSINEKYNNGHITEKLKDTLLEMTDLELRSNYPQWFDPNHNAWMEKDEKYLTLKKEINEIVASLKSDGQLGNQLLQEKFQTKCLELQNYLSQKEH
tara:strand:- start:890 stop:1192 length:303 start_codon:yes stop_codon:yes gene_type:complete